MTAASALTSLLRDPLAELWQGHVLRVFPRRTNMTPTDSMAFIGDPPLERPPADCVLVSCTFTWDRTEAERLAMAWSQYYPDVQLGGPAFGDPGETFTPGLFVRKGWVFTSRGCPHECPWCFVPKREGKIRELPIVEGWNIQDNNLLGCSKPHIRAVFDMCRHQRRAVRFIGGFEAAVLDDWVVEELRGLRIAEVWLSCDHDGAIHGLRRAVAKLSWLPRDRLRCYVMLGYDGETLRQAQDRLLGVWEAGCLPFAQLYRDEADSIRWPWEWRNLARLWSRPAATKAIAAKLLAKP